MRKPDYFGKFGKIHKVVINHSTQYAGSQLQVSLLVLRGLDDIDPVDDDDDDVDIEQVFRELHRGQVLVRMSPTSSLKML